MAELKVPVPKSPVSVVVETLVSRLESVLMAKPRIVKFSPPVAVTSPLNVASVWVTPVAALVVIEGAQGSVVKLSIDPVLVALELAAKALK